MQLAAPGVCDTVIRPGTGPAPAGNAGGCLFLPVHQPGHGQGVDARACAEKAAISARATRALEYMFSCTLANGCVFEKSLKNVKKTNTIVEQRPDRMEGC